MQTNQKVAFVTGGTRGIGRAIVEKLAQEGYIVGFSYVSSDEKANAMVEELKAKGQNVFAMKFDVKDSEKVAEAFDKIYEEYENIDVLVNNAGITRDKLFIKMKEADFDDVIDTNLKGIFNCTKQVARKMTKKRSGRIISLSSKAGVIGMTRTLAAELGPYSITVNAIAPGFIQTDMTDAIPEKIKAKIVDAIPLRSVGQPKDIADTVAFLAGESARYITGQVISVDGGLSSI